MTKESVSTCGATHQGRRNRAPRRGDKDDTQAGDGKANEVAFRPSPRMRQESRPQDKSDADSLSDDAIADCYQRSVNR